MISLLRVLGASGSALAISWALIGTCWACTTAVISGRITADGRPILWKNRDYSSAPRNEVALLTDGRYRVLAVVNAGSRSSVWMGVNEAGLCIENSLSTDLASEESAEGPGNGSFMKRALQTCATVAEVRELLLETNATGRSTTANFGVIDACGGAAIFEASPDRFEMFDVNDPTVAPNGYLVRSNFATSAHGLPAAPDPNASSEIGSWGRYSRACRVIEDERRRESQTSGESAGSIELPFVVQQMTRDLANDQGLAIPGSINAAEQQLPEVIATANTISRSTTVSAAVFHGVRAGEDPRLTTMWVMLGDPKFSIAVPCWVAQTQIADSLSGKHGGELGEIARTLRDASLLADGQSLRAVGLPGIWNDLWPLEHSFLEQTLSLRESWNEAEAGSIESMERWHQRCAERAFEAMRIELQQAKSAALAIPTQAHASEVTERLVRVAVYDQSDGSANGPKNLLRILTSDSGFETHRISPEEIRQGKLSEFDVLIMPGGSGSAQAKRLEQTGRENIRAFVEQGGGYVGICAGSYLATTHYSWSLGLINARVWDRAHWARGTGSVQLALSQTGQEALGHAVNQAQVYYGQGPLLVPGLDSDLPQYEVLAVYETEIVANGAIDQAMTDTHAIVRSIFGEGRVICFSPHPETSSGPNHMIRAGVRWAAENREP